MASSSSKPTGVHYALVVFVLISIVCGLGWLLAYKGANSISDLRRERDAAKVEAEKQAKLANDYFDKVKTLKEKTGATFEEWGSDQNQNSVLGDIHFHMTKYGAGVTDQKYNALIVKQFSLLQETIKERDRLKDELAEEIAKFRQKESEINAALLAEKTARDKGDKEKNDADTKHKELELKQDQSIAEYRKAITVAEQELEEVKESSDKRIKELTGRVTSLSSLNKQIRDELDQAKRFGFDVPDGVIRWIDPVGRKVWVSLGEADGLKPRTTFSVYKKSHSGVGRGTAKGAVGGEDIKGAIEITRVLEANLSEARILDEDIYHPMAKGDPIYSPLWSPARGEAFSIVGIIDLDGDGKDDRDIFKEIVATAGGIIDNDVDEKGVLRVNGKIPEDGKPRVTEKTKFLVIGKILETPDAANPDDITVFKKINDIRKDLEDAARERGVRVVSLSDFLTYIGFKAHRRLFVPGSDVPWNLKSGAASGSVGEAMGSSRRSSGGSTSGAYSGDKMQKSKNSSSNAATPKVFRAGGK